MSRSNHVSQVLVTKGDLAPLAVGSSITDLQPGQPGVFDYSTNLAIDGTEGNRNFYIAVGLDLDGDGATDDVAKSRGTHIQARNVVYYTFRPHTPGQPMEVVLKDYIAKCETEYGIKLELRNREIYQTQGYNQFAKTFTMKTSCCGDCGTGCPTGDANEITRELMINILNDSSGLIKAEAIARQALTAATHGVVADLAKGDTLAEGDLEALIAFNATQTDASDYVYTDLKITTVTQKKNAFGDINLKYFYPRESVVIVSKLSGEGQGFSCTGAVEVTQQAVMEEGDGYDIKQVEYMVKGHDESPYRVSALNGVADNKFYNTDVATKYDQITLSYDQVQKNAWLEYQNPEATIIAIPAGDDVTRNGLVAILDNLLPQFEAKSDASTDAIADIETVEKTEDKTVDTDGIG